MNHEMLDRRLQNQQNAFNGRIAPFLDVFSALGLSHRNRRHSVTLLTTPANLTTQKAADLPGVLRPHLVSLPESGRISFHRAGSHRRIVLKDLLAYKKKQEPEAVNLFLLFLFGVGIGVLSGLLGIGGGVLLVPGLIVLFGFSQVEAQGTSLAVMIPPIGIFAAMVYYEHGFVRLPVVGLIAAGFMAGAFLGAKFVPHVPLGFLRGTFGVLLLYLGFTFVMSPRNTSAEAALPAGLATIASGLLAWLLRRQRPRRKSLQPPTEDQDFHI